MAEEVAAFDRTELRQVYKAFSLLGDEAKAEARQTSNNLATYLQQQIAAKASTVHVCIVPMFGVVAYSKLALEKLIPYLKERPELTESLMFPVLRRVK